jgi:hypothetical protein
VIGIAMKQLGTAEEYLSLEAEGSMPTEACKPYV